MKDFPQAFKDYTYSIHYNSHYIKENKKVQSCSDLHKALELVFSKDYGDEVEQLTKSTASWMQNRTG